MMMTLMMCLVSMSVWGEQDTQKPIVYESNIINHIVVKINSDTININSDTINIYSNSGTISIEGEDKIFNLQGIDVTELFTKNLIPTGLYIVINDGKYVGKFYHTNIK